MNAAVNPADLVGNLTHSSTNDTRLETFMSDVREYGRDSAVGKDALPKLAFRFIRAVADEVLDMGKDAVGDDGAARVFKTYASSEGKKQIHDRSSDSVKAQNSKLRTIGKAASNPKWDFVQVSNDLQVAIQDYKKSGIDTKPTYAALVDVAREQLKSDTQLTYDEIAVLCLPTTKEPKEVTLESKLEKIQKQLEDVITGEDKDGLQDQSSEIAIAAENLGIRRGQLLQLAQAAADDKAQAELDARRAARAA